ncbi:GumC family protein [Chryseobacterium salivictor]|uniref:Tyrosine-protein kinase wzc n=1 Tax=Chryseobacterium salivictor TaxID=2547600 RepID=A0A4P6ZJB9_9FLAO|nr:tyrosine-protein kinase domain-containing protein [Chryseobacterium salivictor]QBO59667.1 Tyrosine-protein kinase wzc [Chryseobacterium salivictor]
MKNEFTEEEDHSSFDLQNELNKYLKKWLWFLLSLIVAFFLAWLYLRYTPKQYATNASILVSTSDKKNTSISMEDFSNLSLGGNLGAANLQDEIAIMKSKPLLYEVVKKLNLDFQVLNEGRVITTNLYDEVPVFGHLEISDPKKFKSQSFSFTSVNAKQFTLKQQDGPEKTHQYGDKISLPHAAFTLYRKPLVDFKFPLTLKLVHPALMVNELENRIVATQDSKNKSSIIALTYVGKIPQKSENILNELIRQYNKDATESKNLESQNTATFIDGRLDLITKELGNIEDQKATFKRNNQITDLVTQAQLSVQNANEATKKIMDVGTQLEMVNSVLTYANSANNEQLLPSNLGMPSGLDNVINEYNQLVLTRNKTLRQATNSNPAVIQFNRDISSMRTVIKENLQKSRLSLQSNMAALQQKVNENKAAVAQFPGQEKIFRNIDRQQNIKEALYLFLLQKREETSISLAVTTPKARVVNPAYTGLSPVSPQNSKIYLIALALGLALPFLLFYLYFFFDTKITNKSDISRVLPNIPLLAEIPTADKEAGDLVMKNDLSIYAEAFRILTTNLKFMLTRIGDRAPVILVTSSVKGEGKTTVSMNSALILSSNKKVVLIGADLRNPQLKRYIPAAVLGLSDYLSDPSISVQNIINTSGLTSNLDIIDSGSIPPNPTDLLEDGRLKLLIDELVMRYDYVLIDSAPMMMVSDSFHILALADVLVYVTRAKYTEKQLLNYVKVVEADENVKKIGIVLNDVDKEELRYGYGGKYGYGYYTDEKKSLWKRLKDKF